MNVELTDFIRQALGKGIKRQDIADTLKQAGWDESDIKAALAAFADVPFAVPVPRPKPYIPAREVFLYLVMFSALYATMFSVGGLIFDYINHLFPDPAQYRFYDLQDALRFNLSCLIIMAPLFLYVFQLANRRRATDSAGREPRPRKWLTYLTLYIAVLSLACDLTCLIYNALGGELTVRFVLKALTVAVIAGGNFLYFLSDMRREEKP